MALLDGLSGDAPAPRSPLDQQYIDKIIGVESGGDASARNPNSSAAGPGQFIDATWLDMLAKHRPDIQGSREDLLALKSDPALAKEMTAAYAADNAGILRQSGLPVTPGTTYLAHFAGPKGAVGLLNADPSTPAGAVLGDAAVKANPFLARMTAGDVTAWAERKMGGKGAAPAAISGQAAQPPAPSQITQASPASPSAPVPAQQALVQPPQAAEPAQAPAPMPNYFAQMPAEQAAPPPPIFMPQRRPPDISKLRAALQASGNRGFIFS
jgi:hypothetical protein